PEGGPEAPPAADGCQFPPPPDPPPHTTSWRPVHAVAIPPAGGIGASAMRRQAPCSAAATGVAGRVGADLVSRAGEPELEPTHPASRSRPARESRSRRCSAVPSLG